jgi:hypothetical protein
MDISKFLITHTGGKKSLTATCFIIGFLVINAKLLLSGITIGDTTLSQFSGIDYGAALAALGGIYALRRNGEKNETTKLQG